MYCRKTQAVLSQTSKRVVVLTVELFTNARTQVLHLATGHLLEYKLHRHHDPATGVHGIMYDNFEK